MTRLFLVLPNPGSGPRALVGQPSGFATRTKAEARIAEIEADHRKPDHTYLDILASQGDRLSALDKAEILF